MFYLWYDNGTNYFDCASKHDALDDAIKAAGEGWKTRQHITSDVDGRDVVPHTIRSAATNHKEKRCPD